VLGQFAHLQADVIHRTFDLGEARIERRRHLLDRLDALVMRDFHAVDARLPLGVDLVEAFAPALVLLGEALRRLVEDQFGVRIHGTKAVLKPGEVVVRWLVLQDRTNPHKSSWRGLELQDSQILTKRTQKAPDQIRLLARSMDCGNRHDPKNRGKGCRGSEESDTNC